MSTDNIALRLQNLSKDYGRIHAVDQLSLEVQSGEMVGFLGPNGAGKSTTLSMITGLVHPTAGTIDIFGYNRQTNFKQAMHHVAAMVETPAFYEYLSARRNLLLVGRLRGNHARCQIDDALRQVGLYGRQHDKVGTYSHGMKQRLGLAAALLGNPRLLLLDEPTNGMDPEATAEILTLLKQKVREEGLTVFLSSHLLYEVEEFCERVFIINQGRLIASGKVREMLAPSTNVISVTFAAPIPMPEVFTGESGIAAVEKIAEHTLEFTLHGRDGGWLNALLLQKGYVVSALIPKQKTLKEFFLAITGDHNHGTHNSRSLAK